ncbi:hypothetical protein C7444_11163 [Sphaerotilus hippei]|uniref:ADP-ribosylglycohydrolase n=1 Tax=Sphaerotilus hippei TaxID=744406 RepID=A0A318H9F9_9BURK|nr:hypothetical protein C7444_11163 [Sphaerotilus hippei]
MLGAIAGDIIGSVAEAWFGLPDEMRRVLKRLYAA